MYFLQTDNGVTDPLNGGNLNGKIYATYNETNYEVDVKYTTESISCFYTYDGGEL